jgi:hypothetical protein
MINANEEPPVDVTAASTAADNPASDDSEEVNVDEQELSERSQPEPREEYVHNSIMIDANEEPSVDKPASDDSEEVNVDEQEISDRSPTDAREEQVSEELVHNSIMINANEEPPVDVTAESTAADNPASDDCEEVNVDEQAMSDRSPTEPREDHVYNNIIINANEEHFTDATAERTAADKPASDESEEVNVNEQEITDRSPTEAKEEQVSGDHVYHGIIINGNEEHFADATVEHTAADKPASDESEEVNVDEQEITDRSPTEAKEEQVSEDHVYNGIITNAKEEHFADATTESTAADKPASDDGEEVDVDEQEITGRSPTEQREEHATMRVEDTLAEEESPTNSEMANIPADDRIELSLPDHAIEKNVHNAIISNANEESVPDATSDEMLPASDSEDVNVDQDCSPNEPEEEHATSLVQVEESPTGSEMANVSDDDRIDFSSPGKASKENVHNETIINANEENVADAASDSTAAKKPASASGEMNVDEREIDDCSPSEPREVPAAPGAVQVEEDTPAEESPASSEKANVSDDRIELSSPGLASEENVHNTSVQSEDNMSASEPAVRSIEEVKIDDQETENHVKENELDGYIEILQSEHQLDEKSSNDTIRLPSVEVEVFHNESASTLTIDSFTRNEDTTDALVDKASNDNEKDVEQAESFEEISETLVKKEAAADEESGKGHSADGGSSNDTNYSRTATIGQHEKSPVEKKVNSSAPVCKMVSREFRKRPLSKGEQMSFGYIRKPFLPSISTISSIQASTHKGVAKKAKSLPPACHARAQDLRKRPTSSGNKKVRAVKDSKPREPLQMLSNQQDKPRPFPVNTKRPVHASMSERNEKQLKKFLDRQAAAREKRAKEAVPAEFHRN